MPDMEEASGPRNGVRVARLQDVEYLASRLRPADVAEVQAMGLDPLQSLTIGFATSSQVYTVALKDGTPIAMFGVVDTGKETGSCWMLGTPEIESHKIEFLRKCRPWVDVLHLQFPLLWNWVDARNTLHLAWLRWIGFRRSTSMPLGVNKEVFHMMIKES